MDSVVRKREGDVKWLEGGEGGERRKRKGKKKEEEEEGKPREK